MNDLLQRSSAIKRLELFLDYLKNIDNYSAEERVALEEFFEDG